MENPITHTKNPIYVGGSVIGMKFSKGIIIASDTRVNYGSLAKLMNVHDRVTTVNQSTVISSTGEYSDFQEVVRLLKEKTLEDDLNPVSYLGPDELANYLSAMHYHRRNKMNPFWNHTIIGGLNSKNKPTLYSIDQFGTILKGDYMLAGMAQYFCNAILHPKYPGNYETLERDQALFLIEDCFRTLFYRDTRAGNQIKYGILFEENGQVKYEEIVRELKSNWDYERFLKQANEKIYMENY
jgi:20S proteasome subunit beta 7